MFSVNSILQSTHMSQKMVSDFHAAVPLEFCQSVSEALLIKHYTTKCSCLFISREDWRLILTVRTTGLCDRPLCLEGSRNSISRFYAQSQDPGLTIFSFNFLAMSHNVFGVVHLFPSNFSSLLISLQWYSLTLHWQNMSKNNEYLPKIII